MLPSLAGSAVVDLTWISPHEGWALLRATCAKQIECTQIARTQTGGSSWTALPNPPTQLLEPSPEGPACAFDACVDELRFATPSIGYLFGPSLLMTRDGGHSWTHLSSPAVASLEPGLGGVVRLVHSGKGCAGPCWRQVEAAPAGSEQWRVLPVKLNDAGTRPQIIRAGEAIYVLFPEGGPAWGWGSPELYRSLDAGRSWAPIPEPCCGNGAFLRPSVSSRGTRGSVLETKSLAAAPGGFLAVLCKAFNRESSSVMTSDDYGDTWGPRQPLPTFAPAYQIAAASPAGLLISNGGVGGGAGGGDYTHTLRFSSDGGQHWSTVASEDIQSGLEVPSPSYLGFENSHVGRWISSPHVIWTTTDGGWHWTRRPFP